jgi:hypothetical protein
MLNISEIGKAICKLIPKDHSSKEKPIIFYLASREDVKENPNVNFFQKYELDKEDEDEYLFQIIPFVSDENPRNVLYTTGQSGSGKSYHTAGFIREYNKMYPKNQVYIFSPLKEDKAFGKCKNINRVNIKSDNFKYNEFIIDDFKDSLVIYDDTDNISDPHIKAQLKSIEDMIMDTGRHSKTFYVRTSHIPSNGRDTKHILLETHAVTLYPSTLGQQSLKYLLQEKIGFSREQIQKIQNLGEKSRWVTIYTSTNPRVILTENGIFIQKAL